MAKKANAQSVGGYFRAIYKAKPSLLNTRSNDEVLQRWLKDHPAEKEIPARVRNIMSNVKSTMRSKGRKRGKRIAVTGAPEAVVASARPSISTNRLETLEEHIDDALTIARNLDREGLVSVIKLLRHARNEVVWKMGQ